MGTTKLERQDSVISILSSGIDLCRICHCDGSCDELISPCYCSGSMRWVHQVCLQHWIRASNNKACELCRYPYDMRSKMKPPCLWESLPMSPSEKRRLFCSAIFHLIALACVIWSLYVLIDRTIEEVYHSELEWQFWTKIVVEAIGCVGAGILIYVWGKSYFSIINKWIAFNRTFVIVSSSPTLVKTPLPATQTQTTINKTSKRPVTPTPPQVPPSHQSQPQTFNLPDYQDSYVLVIPGGSSSPLLDSGVGISSVCICGGGGGVGGSNAADAHDSSSDIDSNIDKSKEVKALLLPPVVYNPPSD